MPREGHVEMGHGQAGADEPLGGPRVHHHGGVHAGEGAALEHEDLAAAALLGRGAEHPDAESDVVGDRGQGQPRADGRGRDDVVPAGVAHVGQSVVLGADRHHELARPDVGLEGRGEFVDPLVDLEPARPQRLRHGLRRRGLVVAELGMGVDEMAE